MNSTQERQKAIFASVFGILFVSTASIFIRYAQVEAASIVIAAARLTIASIVLLPVVLLNYRHEWQSLTLKELGKGVLSGVFLAFHFASWITSLQYTSVASSVVLVTTTPLWVALLSPIILKEHIRKLVIIGLIISVSGGFIVGLSQMCEFSSGRLICELEIFGGEALLGNFLALFGAWMAAGYMLMGRQLRKKLSTISYAGLVYSVSAVILIIAVIIQAEPVFTYSKQTYLWLLALGIIPQLLGHSLFNWSLKYVSAAYVSLSLLGEPIGTIILALIFLKESPTIIESIGALIILIGIVIGSIWGKTPVNAA